MTLPSPEYFLADLPPEASVTPALLQAACQTLRRNRALYLADRSTGHLVTLLGRVAENWLASDYPFLQLALDHGPAATGYSRATLSHGLRAFFCQLTQENLRALILQELGHLQRLDKMSASSAEERAGHAAMATGPELMLHIWDGHVPDPILMSIVRGLLVRSAQVVQCARPGSLIPRLFAHSLYHADPKLGSCLEIVEWAGDTGVLDETLIQEADCVIAADSNPALETIRRRLPRRVRFVEQSRRLSFGFVGNEVLSGFNAKEIAAAAARDVAAWDQRGCLAPHAFFVETGGDVSPERFAEMLAEEMAQRELSEPRGRIPEREAEVIRSKRDFYTVRAAGSLETRIWSSRDSTAWTVVFEADPRFQVSCLNRFIHVKAVADLGELLRHAEVVREQVATVGLAAGIERSQEIARHLAQWGATRVCPIGQMQTPPLMCRPNGRPSLGELVRWTDWER